MVLTKGTGLEYQSGGIEKLKEINFCGPQSKLDEHAITIENYFKEHPPATIKEAMAKIEELTGLKRSEVQIWKFLKRIGLKCRKVGMIPSKVDIEKQETFKKKNWSLVLKKLKTDAEQYSSLMLLISFWHLS